MKCVLCFLIDFSLTGLFFFFFNKKIPTALSSVHLATLTFCFPVSQLTGSGTHALNGKRVLPEGSVETQRGKWRR